MKTKRIVSLILALVMALAMAVPAFATTNADAVSQEVDMSGSVKEPTICIVVSTGNTLYMNPYGLEIELSGTATPKVNSTVVNDVQYIENYSDANISVGATFTATPAQGSDIKMLTAAPVAGKTSTTKDVFLYFEIKAVQAKDATGNTITWSTAYDKSAANQIVYAAKPALKSNLVVLDKAKEVSEDAGKTNNNGELSDSGNGVGAFRVLGEANGQSATAWSATDTIDVKVAFTFIPTTAEATK